MGRVDEARHVLSATRAGDVEPELRTIVRSVVRDRAHEADNHYTTMIFAKTKTQRELRWRVILSVWLQIMQELVGIGVVTVYGELVLDVYGLTLTHRIISSGRPHHDFRLFFGPS